MPDSLPDAWVNQIIECWRKENGMKNHDVTPLDLLAFIGKRGMGALEFVPETLGTPKAEILQLKALTNLAGRIFTERENVRILPEDSITLQSLIAVGTSAGGRQPKAIITINKDTGEIRSGQIAGQEGCECRYGKDDFLGEETRFVQKNLLEYLKQKTNWGKDDLVLMFLTDKARENNWDKGVETRFNSKRQKYVPYVRLEKVLQDMDVSYLAVSIPEGRNAEEMWELFEVIFEQLQDGDELYLDITNSFRYLPMLLVVLVNYAKLLKDVTVKAIFYGNYEARDSEDIAPIMDLLPLSVLQDWTLATSDYLRYGQVKKLHELTESSMQPLLRDPSKRTEDVKLLRQFVKNLKDMVEERVTCRGKEIVESKKLCMLEKNASKIQKVMIVQLKPLFEKLKESLEDFDATGNVLNCVKAAKWCLDNKLYQQATTLLEEGLITVLCCRYQLDYKNVDDRNLITSCVAIKTKKKETYQDGDQPLKNNTAMGKILSDTALWNNRQYISLLQEVVELRNDYNHAGFKKQTFSSDNVIRKIEKLMGIVENMLKESTF